MFRKKKKNYSVKKVKFPAGYFSSGGTPPAEEQSARAEALVQFLGKNDLASKNIARQLKRIWSQKRSYE